MTWLFLFLWLISSAFSLYFFMLYRQAAAVCLQTYTVMGSIASDNQFVTVEMQNLLDNLLAAKPIHDIIPMRPLPK